MTFSRPAGAGRMIPGPDQRIRSEPTQARSRYGPTRPTTAFRSFLLLCRQLLFMAGDSIDRRRGGERVPAEAAPLQKKLQNSQLRFKIGRDPGNTALGLEGHSEESQHERSNVLESGRRVHRRTG